MFRIVSRYPELEVRILDRVISDISVILTDNTLTNLDSIETGSNVESKIVSLSKTEITEITRFTKPIVRVKYLKNKTPLIGWLVVLGFNATSTAKVILWRSVTHICVSWLSHTSTNTTFLSKATDYFSHMLLQR